jgi:WhiB family redox-sensing transcriptional regulator
VNWYEKANCRNHPTSLFFTSEDEKPAQRRTREAKAKALCLQCEVQAECFVAGFNEYGIWGGKTERERRDPPSRQIMRPIAQTFSTSDNGSPWMVLEKHEGIELWQRDSQKTWHGAEWAVAKSGEIIRNCLNLEEAYIAYHGMLC